MRNRGGKRRRKKTLCFREFCVILYKRFYASSPKERSDFNYTNEVFTNLAGNAATSCFGVKGMVGRAKDSGPFQLLRRESMSKGVEVHFNDDESVSLELHIGVDQGVNISAVSRSIMKEVSYKLTKATGVPVKSVDVFVDTIIG